MSHKPRLPMPPDLGVEVGPERDYLCPQCRKRSEAWRFVVANGGIKCGTCHGSIIDCYPKRATGLDRRTLGVGVPKRVIHDRTARDA